MSRRSSSSILPHLVGLAAATATLGTVLLVAGVNPAAASSSSSFLSDINHSRSQHGLRPLSMSSSLNSVASSWSQHMASGGCGGGQSICHNPNLTGQVSGWQKIGENVGVGPDENSIENAFMNSSPHRANILDPAYALVGIGTATGKDGRLYVTQDFEKPMGSSTSSPKTTSSSHKPASAAPVRGTRSAPAVKPATPRSAASQLTARLRSLTARAGAATDPVDQAFRFLSTMRSLTV